MDSNATSLLSGSDDNEPISTIITNNIVPIIAFFMLVITTSFFSYTTFMALRSTGSIKFTVESVACAGLDLATAGASGLAAVSPSFNVTLRARSTHSWVEVCSTGQAAMEVTYSGVTFAMADVEPFCIGPKGERVITVSASPGWPALPGTFLERMESDRRQGGVEMEVDFSFRSLLQGEPYDEAISWWVRCTTMLGADQPSRCKSYVVTSC